MKKTALLLIAVAFLSFIAVPGVSFSMGDRHKDAGDRLDDAGDDIEDGIEDTGDKIKDATN
jgi:hypothetical protein